MNTDEIIPGRYNITIDPLELAKNVFCEVKPEYAKNVQPDDIIVGGQNFGCGSSREHAPIAIKGSQAKCIIAPSFARIFFRNCINIGLPILECRHAGKIQARWACNPAVAKRSSGREAWPAEQEFNVNERGCVRSNGTAISEASCPPPATGMP